MVDVPDVDVPPLDPAAGDAVEDEDPDEPVSLPVEREPLAPSPLNPDPLTDPLEPAPDVEPEDVALSAALLRPWPMLSFVCLLELPEGELPVVPIDPTP